MAATEDPDRLADVPEARTVRGGRGPSLVWLVPLAALVAGGWLVYKTLMEQGPTISIRFENAEGIQVGKTKVKLLSVDLGTVSAVRLAGKDTGVVVKVDLIPGSEPKLTETTRFWVVRPRIEATGVSGVGTLLSGAYIGMDPGSGGEPRRRFDGLPEPPRVLSHQEGRVFTLRAADLGSLYLGSPVYFRRIQVGSVVGYGLAEDHRHVEVEVFIEAPHDRYVRRSSRFWNVSGVRLEASAEGVELEVGSLVSIFSGGIAFATEDAIGATEPASEGAVFTLYEDRKQSVEQVIAVEYPYMVYFDESVRGLQKGAAVEFRGIRVGTVKDIRPVRDPAEGSVRIGVLVGVEPERLPFKPAEGVEDGSARALAMIRKLVAAGGRARLETGNLLTGQKFISFDIYPEAPPAEVTLEDGYPVVPSVPGPLKGITDSVTSILARLEALPVEQIARNLNEAAAGANRLVGSGELERAVASLASAMAEADRLLAGVGERTPVLLDSMTRLSSEAEALLAEAAGTSAQAEATLKAFEAIATEEGPFGTEALAMLREIREAARAIRVLAAYLERHPEALVSGKR